MSHKVLPDDENGKSLTLLSFRNKAVYLESCVVHQNEIFDSVKRFAHDSDWNITDQGPKKRYQDGMAEVRLAGFSKLLYTRAFDSEGPSDVSFKAQNELLGLPEQCLDDATKDGVDLVQVLQQRVERMAS